MKKSLLLGLACTFGLVSTMNAQTYITNPQVIDAPSSINLVTPFLNTLITGYETNTGLEKSIPGPAVNPYTNKPPVQFGVETIIGITTYDLQSNSAVQNRIMNNGDGTISAVWTYSESFDIAAADRGTGYNFFDGVAWGAQPTARIEGEKTGWPNIGRTDSGSEVFICHNIAQGRLTQGSRTTIGSGPWALSNVTNTDQVWNRMAIGGSNGQTIHHVSLFDPFGGPWTNGVQSQLLYWRSQDGGATYDIEELTIPGLDETNYTSFSGDSYHIAAKGDTVVVVYFGALDPTMMAKSTDNGTTWTTTTVINVFPAGVIYDAGSANTTGSPIGISDVTGDGVADTVSASDGAGWVMLDHDGMAHVFFGNMDYADDTPADDQWSFFPSTNGMMYWNESFGDRTPVTIGGALDLDSNGVLDILADIAQYQQALSAFPSAGIADDGCMYVSYSAVVENMDQGTQNYRHVYIVKSCDGGCSWSAPVDVTPGTGFEENVYCSMAHDVDANINIVWQRDFEPGIAVNGDMDAYVSNDIVHSSIPVTDINTAAAVCIGWIDGDSLFCAGDSVLLTASCGNAWLWSNGATTQSTYYKGAFGAVNVDITTNCGLLQQTINVAAPGVAPILTLTSTTNEMCNGDQATLTVTSNAGGIISWSTGATTSTITVDSIGIYVVTVQNCGGISTDTVIVALPAAPDATISGNVQFCTGDTITLTAVIDPAATYAWSTGSSSTSVSVMTEAVILLSVSNCGGTNVDSVTTAFYAAPTVNVIGGTGDEFCEDGITDVTISAFAAGASPFVYVWSNGDTIQNLTLSTAAESGTYSVTAFDACGSSVVGPVDIIDIYSTPIADTVSLTHVSIGGANDGAIDATVQVGTGTSPFVYEWSTVPAQTTEDATNLSAGTYTLQVTDANNCSSTVTATIEQLISINEINIGAFSIHPNPNNGNFVVNLSGLYNEEYSFEIRNILGQMLYSETFNGMAVRSVALDLSDSNKGVYFLTISNSKGKRTEKLIIH